MSFSRLVLFAVVLVILAAIYRGVRSEIGTHGSLREEVPASTR